MSRQNVSSGTVWEDNYAYSRVVRIGNVVAVAGTVASDEAGNPQGETSYEQAQYIFNKIERYLAEVGSSLNDVIRTRVFVVDINEHSDGVGRAHKERFDKVRPVMSMIGIAELIGDGFILEIEVDAVLNR